MDSRREFIREYKRERILQPPGPSCPAQLTTRIEVIEALRSEHFSTRSRHPTDVLLPLGHNGPEHARYRAILQPFFTPRRATEFEPTLRTLATALIAPERGSCDAVSDIAIPYAAGALLSLLGFWEDLDLMTGVLRDFIDAKRRKADRSKAIGWIFMYLREVVKDPPPGLMADLIDVLAEEEVVAFCWFLVNAGVDTVAVATSFAMLELARNPQLQATLRENPTQTRGFIEEIVRLNPPVKVLPRWKIDTDESVWLRVDAVNIEDMNARAHWSFGGGRHRCLGSHLARLELGVIVNEWLCRITEFALAPGFIPQVIDGPGVGGLTSLELKWF